jgi:transcriptional regulator with XRE-family HTH domain
MDQRTDTDGGPDVYLGAKLRAAREHLGWSEQALAARMRIKVEHVRGYETGVNHIAAPRRVKLSDILQVPIGYFFGGPAAERPTRSAPSMASRDYRTTLALVQTYWQIPDRAYRQMVLDLIKEVAERDTGSDRDPEPH